MGMHGAESIASSGAGHQGLDHLPIKDGVLNPENEQDDLLQAPSLEAGIFGVLFTLSQEKNEQHIRYHWILLKILLDSWQLFSTITTPEMGWDIDPESTAWKVVSVLNFQWLKELPHGYTWYVVILYSVAGLLAINLALCVWVAWSFKEQKFDYVWPIKVVRGFSYVFLQVFDITSLNFLQLGISCNYVGPVVPHLHMALFPSYSCSTTPHIINAVISGILLLLFVVVAMLVNMSEVEVNPASKQPQGLGHSGAEVTAICIKALLTLVNSFIGWPTVAAVAYMLLALWLAWVYLRWAPHLLTWVNCLKSGVAVAILGVAALQVAVVCFKGQHVCVTLTYVMAIAFGPLFVAGALGSWLRIKLFTAAVLKAFTTADPEAIKPQDIYHFYDPRDVELAARSARVWTDLYTLEKTAVHRAEAIIKGGVALFPDDAFASLVYANFMLDMLGFSQTGARQLESVRKLNPGIMCRFMLFIRHQQATQKAASSTVGKGGSMDLLGYVEYQRKQRMVLRHHKDALQAMANFWRYLGSSTVSFTSLSKALEDIDTSVSQAETAYRVVLELYNNSPRLVRLYARFLETIKQDPWSAAEYHAAAERLEENKDEDGQGPVLPDGTPISRMDDVEKGVLVVNAFGDIQVANRKLHAMFGYKKGDLDGKNVTVLMPPHEAKRHPAILRRYIDSGDKAAPYFRHPVLAIHRERVAFTTRIAVSRASGLGEDSVFIGILEALPTEPGQGRLWVSREGVIVCCDPGFVTCFGYHPEDIIGAQLDKLLRSGSYDADKARSADVWTASQANQDNHELVQRMLEAAIGYGGSLTPDLPPPPPVKASVLHKYDFAKEVVINVRTDVTKSSIFEVKMSLLSDEPQLLMVVERKGAIRHMSGDLAKILGVGVRDSLSGARAPGGGAAGNGAPSENIMADDQVMLELMSEEPQRSLDDFLPTPWKFLHYKYRKYVTGGSPGLSGAWGCRAEVSHNSGSKGPTMRLVGLHGKPVFVHVGVSSREEDGEPMHVVRMARSSMETAVGERRLRIRVAEDGVVQELCLPPPTSSAADASVNLAGADLFGFSGKQLVGCRLWEFLSLQYNSISSNGQPPQHAAIELEEQPGRSTDGSLRKASKTPSRLSAQNLNFYTFDNMITSTLQTPGISWRVNIVPPSAVAEAAAMGNPARAAAVLARRTKQAILRLDVALSSSSKDKGPGKLHVHAELWAIDAVTGVIEINSSGRVSNILEEEIRPPGLLFGLSREDILGAQLSTLLRFGPDQSAPGLLTESGVAKKSSLKASSRKGRVVEKVGPIHYLEGNHRDHQPLPLAVQVIGKPGPGQPVIAILRFASEKNAAVQRAKKQAAAAAAAAPAAGGPGAPLAARGHVLLDVGRRTDETGTTAMMGGPPARVREASFSKELPSNMMALPTPSLKGASSFRGAGGGTRSGDGRPNPSLDGVSGKSLAEVGEGRARSFADGLVSRISFDERRSLADGPPRISFDERKRRTVEAKEKEEKDEKSILKLDSSNLPGTPQASALKAIPSNSSMKPPSLTPRMSSDLQGGAPSGTTTPPPVLPGTSSLAAGVACVIKAKTMTQPTVMSRGVTAEGDLGAAPAANAQGVASVPRVAALASKGCLDAGGADGEGTRNSSPVKPESPPIAPSKRTVSSPRGEAKLTPNAADLKELRDKRAGKGSDSLDGPPGSSDEEALTGKRRALEEDMSLENAILALDGGGGSGKVVDSGLGGVDKWVASGGEYYRNKAPSRRGSDMDDDDDLEDDDGSIGATSRATSSRAASPRASASGLPTDLGDDEDAPLPHHHHHHHHQQQQLQQRMQPAKAELSPGRRPVGAPGGGWEGSRPAAAWPAPPGGGKDPADEDAAAGAADAGPDDFGEDRSDGGESAVSGFSGASGLSDGNSPADFKRGKRYRKLVKLLDSPQAQKAIVRLRVHTGLALCAAGAVHIVCFALILTAVHRQSEALDHLETAGGAQRYFQRALVAVRALDVGYQGRGNNFTYTINDTTAFADDMMLYSTMYRNVNDELLRFAGSNVEDLYYSSFVEVWSGYNVTTNQAYYQNITLWDMVTRSFVSAKDIFQNHVTWYQQGLNISSTLSAAFLLNSGQQLVLGMRQIIDAMLDQSVKHTADVNVLQLAFLIIEGCVVTSVCAIVLVLILRAACDQRYQLYETFLKIPVGLTRALASQTTHLLDDDESEDEDDDDAGSVNKEQSGDAGGPIRRKAAFEDGNSNGPASAHPSERSPLPGRGPSGGKAASALSPVRGAGGQKLMHMDDSMRNGGAGGGFGSPSMARGRNRGSTDMSFGSEHYQLLLSGNGREASRPQSWWARFTSKFWRSSAVSPLNEGRRTLQRNSKVSSHMMLIIIAYSVLIILFYSIAYTVLLTVENKVAMQAVADHTVERTYRTVFYAQELAAELNSSALPARIQNVRNATIALRDAYYSLRMGGRAWTAVGPDVETFPLADEEGITKETETIFHLFYTTDTCLRLAEHFPCEPPSWRFYQVTRAGVDGMMTQLLGELKYLADEAEAAFYSGTGQAGLNSSRWDYIYNVGTTDLMDGTLQISSEHLAHIKNEFQVVIIMHVVLFLLLLCVFTCFLAFIYLPLLRRMSKEKRRIAEMMSQLPPELDVMRLVSTALLGDKPHHHQHRMPSGAARRGSMAAGSMVAAAAAATDGAGVKKGYSGDLVAARTGSGTNADGDDAAAGNKAYQAWKDILSRASSLNPPANQQPGQHPQPERQSFQARRISGKFG